MNTSMLNSLLTISLFAVLGPFGGSTFEGLGYLDVSHNESQATAVSADGTAVIGFSQLSTGPAPMAGGVRWNIMDNNHDFIPATPGPTSGFPFPTVVSASGEYVAGFSFSVVGYCFTWDEMAGSVYLTEGAPGAMSHDGTVITGNQELLVDGFPIAAAWRTVNGVFSFIGGLPQTTDEDRVPGAITPDGTLIAGRQKDVSGFSIFVWDEINGFEYLQSPAEWSTMFVTDMTANGNLVVGRATHPSGTEAVIWRRGLPAMPLGDFPDGDLNSNATAVSRGGHLVLGFGETDIGSEAFLWDKVFGFQHLGDWLTTKYGLDLGTWVLREVRGFSDDNRVIAGIGINPDGNFEGWVARLEDALLGLTEYIPLWETGEVTLFDLISAV